MKKDKANNSVNFESLNWTPKVSINHFKDNKGYFFGTMHKSVKLDDRYKIIATATKDDMKFVIIEHPVFDDVSTNKPVKEEKTIKKETPVKKEKVVKKTKKVKKVKKMVKKTKKVKKSTPKKVAKKVKKTKKVTKKKSVKMASKKTTKKGKGKK